MSDPRPVTKLLAGLSVLLLSIGNLWVISGTEWASPSSVVNLGFLFVFAVLVGLSLRFSMARVPLLAVLLLSGLGWAQALPRTYAVAPTYFIGLGYLSTILMLAVQSGFLPLKKPPTG